MLKAKGRFATDYCIVRVPRDNVTALINYYLFPEDYPLFYNIFPDRSKNKAKAIELLLSILKRIDDDNSLKIPSTINVQLHC